MCGKNDHTERCFTSYVIRELQAKTGHHCTLVFQSQTLMLWSVDEDVEQQECSPIAARNAQGMAPLEVFGCFYKVKYNFNFEKKKRVRLRAEREGRRREAESNRGLFV